MISSSSVTEVRSDPAADAVHTPGDQRRRMPTGGVWQRFVAANKRICHNVLQPRLYAMSHITALMWWFSHHVPRQTRPGALLEFGSGSEFPLSRLLGQHFARQFATYIEAPPPSTIPDGVDFRICVPGKPLPFETGSIDAVVIRSVLEHVSDPRATFREIDRVLAPGGRVFLNLPNKWDYVSVLARLMGPFKSAVLQGLTRPSWEDFPVFYRCNTKRALRRALSGTGLQLDLFRPWPSEPSYLKFFVPFYVAGAVYQFVISVVGLDLLQPAFIAILRKQPGGER